MGAEGKKIQKRRLPVVYTDAVSHFWRNELATTLYAVSLPTALFLLSLLILAVIEPYFWMKTQGYVSSICIQTASFARLRASFISYHFIIFSDVPHLFIMLISYTLFSHVIHVQITFGTSSIESTYHDYWPTLPLSGTQEGSECWESVHQYLIQTLSPYLSANPCILREAESSGTWRRFIQGPSSSMCVSRRPSGRFST